MLGSYGRILKYSDIALQVLTRAIPSKIMVILKSTLDVIVSPLRANIQVIRQESIGNACTLIMNVTMRLEV